MREKNKKIVFEDGEEYLGYGFGADKECICEIVFNTSMVGYQEIVSDPSYTYQTVVMTYPLIGNYGITDEDYETRQPTIGGLVVREYNDLPSNFRYTKTLSEIYRTQLNPTMEEVSDVKTAIDALVGTGLFQEDVGYNGYSIGEDGSSGVTLDSLTLYLKEEGEGE